MKNLPKGWEMKEEVQIAKKVPLVLTRRISSLSALRNPIVVQCDSQGWHLTWFKQVMDLPIVHLTITKLTSHKNLFPSKYPLLLSSPSSPAINQTDSNIYTIKPSFVILIICLGFIILVKYFLIKNFFYYFLYIWINFFSKIRIIKK